MKKKYSSLVLYLLFFIYYELVCKILMFNKLPDFRFIYVVLFSLTTALLLNLISKNFKEKNQSKIIFVFIFLISAFYIFNYLYFSLLTVPFSVSTLELASQAMDFYEIGFDLIISKIIEVLILLIPFILFIIYKKRIDYTKNNKKQNIIVVSSIIIIYFFTILGLNFDKKDLYSAFNLYYKVDAMTTSNNVLGILTTQRLSLQRNIFGFEDKMVLKDSTSDSEQEKVTYNELDIDFDSLIESTSDETEKNAYTYLKNNIITEKNDYTGYYEGKNLIFILAEGFNSIAVSEELTPTLYKMINQGFNFTNYYSPVFLSTTGGEFQAMTSLIPTQEILGIWRNNSPYLPYSLGNAFSKIGYKAQSYHNWSYKYYGRNKTMPILGFDNYTACGNGLEEKINCSWLPSDVDLINASIDDYASDTPFVTYYISVSGHAPYNFTGGNSIALKNKEKVESLPYSDSVKAYLASQIELDSAINTLIEQLDQKGILDDTVIVLTGDHYPYTLTTDEINEISTYERDDIIEVNHSNLIIWNNKDEGVVVDKVASQIDVLPTVLNLFGIEYDSRLLLGNDIFSSAEGLAIFSNRSWISDKGKYITNKGFTKTSSSEISDDYVDTINNRVLNSFTISKLIMEQDLYRKILDSEE